MVGDGGFAHVWAEIETAVRERLDIVVVVLDNSILGYQKHAEIVQFGRPTGAVELGSVDHAAIATACGGHGHTIHTAAQFREALEKGLTDSVITVLDVIVDPNSYPPINGWEDSPPA